MILFVAVDLIDFLWKKLTQDSDCKFQLVFCINLFQYNWEEANILIIKITANVIVISLLQAFRPSSGAIFNEQ